MELKKTTWHCVSNSTKGYLCSLLKSIKEKYNNPILYTPQTWWNQWLLMIKTVFPDTSRKGTWVGRYWPHVSMVSIWIGPWGTWMPNSIVFCSGPEKVLRYTYYLTFPRGFLLHNMVFQGTILKSRSEPIHFSVRHSVFPHKTNVDRNLEMMRWMITEMEVQPSYPGICQERILPLRKHLFAKVTIWRTCLNKWNMFWVEFDMGAMQGAPLVLCLVCCQLSIICSDIAVWCDWSHAQVCCCWENAITVCIMSLTCAVLHTKIWDLAFENDSKAVSDESVFPGYCFACSTSSNA